MCEFWCNRRQRVRWLTRRKRIAKPQPVTKLSSTDELLSTGSCSLSAGFEAHRRRTSPIPSKISQCLHRRRRGHALRRIRLRGRVGLSSRRKYFCNNRRVLALLLLDAVLASPCSRLCLLPPPAPPTARLRANSPSPRTVPQEPVNPLRGNQAVSSSARPQSLRRLRRSSASRQAPLLNAAGQRTRPARSAKFTIPKTHLYPAGAQGRARHQCLRSPVFGKDLDIRPTATLGARRDFIHVSDLGAAHVKGARSSSPQRRQPDPPEPWNRKRNIHPGVARTPSRR